MQGLAYIHAQNIVHRDLKPGKFIKINCKKESYFYQENILIGD